MMCVKKINLERGQQFTDRKFLSFTEHIPTLSITSRKIFHELFQCKRKEMKNILVSFEVELCAKRFSTVNHIQFHYCKMWYVVIFVTHKWLKDNSKVQVASEEKWILYQICDCNWSTFYIDTVTSQQRFEEKKKKTVGITYISSKNVNNY